MAPGQRSSLPCICKSSLRRDSVLGTLMSSPPHPEGEVIAPSSYSATPNPADENGQPRVRGRGRNVLAAPATYILVGINCAVFLWMIVHGVSPREPTIDQLKLYGATNPD